MDDMLEKDGPSKRPHKEVFTVVNRDGLRKPIWLRVGVGFQNQDNSFTIWLDAQPVNGKLVMRDPKPWDDRRSNGGFAGAGDAS
jgi:hypothetical protein